MSDFFYDIEEYLLNHSDEEDPILAELNRETNLKILRPRMLSGHLQGKFLEMIGKMIQPEKILEIGTYTGYSAICLAKGLKENGILHTIEINDELEDFITKYLKKAQVQEKVKLHFGDARKIVTALDESFDLVFIDADKTEYIEYYQIILDFVKPGGFIVVDNVLWSGKVLEQTEPEDVHTKGVIEFNEFIKNDQRVEKVMLPIRDGLTLIRKK